jgi:hypothetical protein
VDGEHHDDEGTTATAVEPGSDETKRGTVTGRESSKRPAWETATIGELEGPKGQSLIRKHFGIRSFGVNGWTAHEAGAIVIDEHDERPSGHEELYVVATGHARFTVDGTEVDAAAGALVFVREPASTRGAVATQGGTTVVSIGGKPGEAFEPRAWETNRDVFALFDRGDFAGARRLLEESLEEYADKSVLLYNLACAEAQLGETTSALDHLAGALRERPTLRENAREDDDLATLRDDSRFEELVKDPKTPG